MLKRTNIQHLAEIEEGVPLWGCKPGSPAALAGLRYGDIVLFVNGQRTRTVDEYVAAKGIGDRHHEIVFRRGAETRRATIAPGPAVWPNVTEDMIEAVEAAGAGAFWTHQGGDAPTSRN